MIEDDRKVTFVTARKGRNRKKIKGRRKGKEKGPVCL
jgi:hypothetical protein